MRTHRLHRDRYIATFGVAEPFTVSLAVRLYAGVLFALAAFGVGLAAAVLAERRAAKLPLAGAQS